MDNDGFLEDLEENAMKQALSGKQTSRPELALFYMPGWFTSTTKIWDKVLFRSGSLGLVAMLSLSSTAIFAQIYLSRGKIQKLYSCSEEILQDTGSIAEAGAIQWEILVANLVSFIIIFLVLLKGIETLGKVSTNCSYLF